DATECAFNPVFPVRCKSLALPFASCYHWPMSREQLISQPSRLPLPSRRASKFPKWNAVKIAPHPNASVLAENPRLCPSLLTTGHSPFTRKLENSLTRSYSATSKFLIDNFH